MPPTMKGSPAPPTMVHNAQGSYAMGGEPDVTPETAEEIFK